MSLSFHRRAHTEHHMLFFIIKSSTGSLSLSLSHDVYVSLVIFNMRTVLFHLLNYRQFVRVFWSRIFVFKPVIYVSWWLLSIALQIYFMRIRAKLLVNKGNLQAEEKEKLKTFLDEKEQITKEKKKNGIYCDISRKVI